MDDKEKQKQTSIKRKRNIDYSLRQRADIILLSAQGCEVKLIRANAAQLGELIQRFEYVAEMRRAAEVTSFLMNAVINEYFVRAFQIRFMEQNYSLFPEFDIEEEYKRQKECFIFIDDFVELLKNFEKENTKFSEFYLSNIDEMLNSISETK